MQITLQQLDVTRLCLCKPREDPCGDTDLFGEGIQGGMRRSFQVNAEALQVVTHLHHTAHRYWPRHQRLRCADTEEGCRYKPGAEGTGEESDLVTTSRATSRTRSSKGAWLAS